MVRTVCFHCRWEIHTYIKMQPNFKMAKQGDINKNGRIGNLGLCPSSEASGKKMVRINLTGTLGVSQRFTAIK